MHPALTGKSTIADLADVEVSAVVELGRTRISLSQARSLTVGDTVPLTRLAGEPYEVRINDHPFGEGEAVVVADRICLRLTQLEPIIEEQRASNRAGQEDR